MNSSIRLLCLAVVFSCLYEQLFAAKIVKRADNKEEFICPDDGKWPHETSCGKYYNCKDGIVMMTGWCGPKMSFDADNQRCEMAYGINCKDGDRPDWVAPDGWMGTTRSTTTTTRRTRKTQATQSTVASSDLTTVPEGAMKENDDCSFEGLMPDKGNCERYFYCKNNKAHRATCIAQNYFDEETKMCKDSKSVQCGERPISNEVGNRCKSRPNGIYPNYSNGCSEFYHCNNQDEVKKGDCPKGLKFNSETLRCDWPANVLAPCGTKPNFSLGNSASSVNPFNFLFVLINTAFMSVCLL